MIRFIEVIKQLILEKKERINLVNRIVIHHSVEDGGVDSVDSYHKHLWNFRSKLGFYVGYHYYINREGRIYNCRQDGERGAHTVGQNDGLGICLMGNGEVRDFTPEQYKALDFLLEWKMKEYNLKWKDIYGHKDFSATACPSHRLYNWIQGRKSFYS